MHCSICESPLLMAPGVGWYCPELQCHWHEGLEEDQQRVVDEYEKKRRGRDGKVYVGMPQAVWLKLLEKCQADCERAQRLWQAIKV